MTNNLGVPYSQEAEEALLGAVLTNVNAYAAASDFITPQSFFLLRHRYIWQAISRVVARGYDYDVLVIAEELRALNKLEEIGGEAYLVQLIASTPSTIHAETYARLVERAYVRRRLLEASDKIHALALADDKSTEDALREAESAFADVRLSDDSSEQSADAAGAAYLESMAAVMAGETTPGLPTGYTSLDKLIGGLKPGQNILIGAATSMGKTALMLSIILNVAKQGKRVFLWSGEMTIEENTARLIAMLSGVGLAQVVNKACTPEEAAKVARAVEQFRRLPITINDGPLTALQLTLRAKRHAMRGLDLIVVDYLGLLSVPSAENRRLELSAASWTCKRLAKTLNVPVLAAAQLSRDFAKQADKRPGLHDFKESGDLENNADIALGLYRDDVYDPDSTTPNVGEVSILKHRNGPRGRVYLYFDAERAHFRGDADVRHVDLSERVRWNGGSDHD